METTFDIACKLETLLHKIHYTYKGKQGEIRCNPCEEIKICLQYFIVDNAEKTEQVNKILQEIETLEKRTLDIIIESEDVKVFNRVLNDLDRLIK